MNDRYLPLTETLTPMHRFLENPLALELTFYGAVVLVGAGLILSSWVAPLFSGGMATL